jgi:hypothetical protein
LAKASWQDFTWKKSSCNSRWNQELNYTIFYSKLQRQCRFKVKLNYYWMNLYKN